MSDYYVPGGTCRNCGHTAASCQCVAFNVETPIGPRCQLCNQTPLCCTCNLQAQRRALEFLQGTGPDITNVQQLQSFVLPEMPDLVELQRLANRAHFMEAIAKCVTNEQIRNAIVYDYDNKHYPEPQVSRAYGCTGCGFAFETKRKPKLCPDCGMQGTLARDPGNDRR